MVALTVAAAMAMVVTKANVAMAMVAEVQVAAGAEAAMLVGVVATRRHRDTSLSTSGAIRRNRGTYLPPRSMEWIRLTDSCPTSCWSHRHAVVATRHHGVTGGSSVDTIAIVRGGGRVEVRSVMSVKDTMPRLCWGFALKRVKTPKIENLICDPTNSRS